MRRAWFCAKPAWVNALRAIRWYSGSVSTLVSVEPGRIPRSSQMPELPQPVPISTAVLAPTAQARKRSAAPTSGSTGSVPPRSAAFARAASSGSSSGTDSAASARGPIPSSLAPDPQVRELSGLPARYLDDTGRARAARDELLYGIRRYGIRTQLAQRKNPGHDGDSHGTVWPGGGIGGRS